MKKFKLRIYCISGNNKGNLDHEEQFDTKESMKQRYKDLYQRELGLLNPTAWEYKNDTIWGTNWYKLPDAEMQT